MADATYNWTNRLLDAIKPTEKIETAPPPRFTGPIYGAAAPKNVPGMVAPGNTDLSKLPIVRNPDKSYSTVHSMGIQDENPSSPYFGKQVLARGIVNGVTTNDADAVRREYQRTGQHLGVFSGNPSSADPYGDQYGEKLHSDWSKGYIPGVKMGTDDDKPTNLLGKVPR